MPKLAQDAQADYEGELCFIISKDAKDVSEADAYAYVGGYLCGNDVSSRKLQRDPLLAGTVPQWNFSKGFDTYAPLGPQIVSTEVVPDPAKLYLKTTVNGEVRQSETIDDLCFKIHTIVSYCSQGTTLKRGTVVMTGTPAGESMLGFPCEGRMLMLEPRRGIRDEEPAVPEARRRGRGQHQRHRHPKEPRRIRLRQENEPTLWINHFHKFPKQKIQR